MAVKMGVIGGKKIAFITRHGKNHIILSNMINYRANLLALKELEVRALVSTTVCGVLDPSILLGRLVVFEDMYFPENRLPDGEDCTVYSKEGDRSRGHYIFDKPFCEELRLQIIRVAEESVTDAVYAHVNGPRFNTKPEISMLRNFASFVSQTAGPEIIIAGELEIPCALLGFGVDYANGVAKEPTPVDVLDENLKKSKQVFVEVIQRLLKYYTAPKFTGFIYRFE